MSELQNQVKEAVAFIRTQTKITPDAGIILGTGLGGLVGQVKNKVEIPYQDIPHFPVSTVEGHSGKLILGKLNGRNVVVMQGRFHLYEGYSLQKVTFPVRVMSHCGGLGARTLVVTNAAGGLNPQFRAGDLMMIIDHINLLGANPLTGKNDEAFGPRFPDMSEPYSKRLQELVNQIALDLKIPLQRGVFVAVPGPSLETRAEHRFLRLIGADAVSMSTVPENIAAVHMGMEVLAISTITNECVPDAPKSFTHQAVIDAAGKAEPRLTMIVKEFVKRLK